MMWILTELKLQLLPLLQTLFKDRETDMIVKLNLKNEDCAYLYILYEFQSSPDRFITLRILMYLLLFYQELIKTEQVKSNDMLPPVFPVLIYTDRYRLTAPTSLEELIVKPYKKLLKFIPRFETYKLTFRELQDEKDKLDKLSNFDNNLLAAILSFLVSTKKEESKEKALCLQNKINTLEDSNLRRFLGIWLRGYTKYKKINVNIDIDEGGVIMLETLFEKTREEGKIEGIKEGKVEMARKLLDKGFSIEELAQMAEVSVEEIKKAMTEQ